MSRYPKKNSIYSSHNFIENEFFAFETQSNSAINVLDVGCATGELGGKFLPNRKLNFYGIEPFEIDAEIAASRGYKVWNEVIETAIQKININFHVVVAGDVLEHLINPKHILEELFKKLEPSGILIISVPNIANIFIRVNLLFGRFDYTEKGILDKTHLRFFTQKSFKELISIEGADVEKLTTSTIPIEIIYPVLHKNYFGRKLLQLLHLVTLALPRLLGYQHLCVLRKI